MFMTWLIQTADHVYDVILTDCWPCLWRDWLIPTSDHVYDVINTDCWPCLWRDNYRLLTMLMTWLIPTFDYVYDVINIDLWSCLWRDKYTETAGTKWRHRRSRFGDFQTLIFNRQGEKWSGKLLCGYIFVNPFPSSLRAYGASSVRFPF